MVRIEQSFGSRSRLDQWIHISGSEIRIRIQEGKKTHKNRKKLRYFMLWSAGCSFLRAVNCFHFLVINTLDWIRIGIQTKMLVSDPYQTEYGSATLGLRTTPECREAGRPLLGGWPAGVHGPDRPSSPPPHATPAQWKWTWEEINTRASWEINILLDWSTVHGTVCIIYCTGN